MSMRNKWVFPNIAALILVLAVNTLASVLPINGQTTADVSDAYPVLFTPAGYVFSIWGIIYLLLIGFTVYQALPAQKNNEAAAAPGGLFALSCLLNSGWIFAWHYNQMLLSVVIMAALLLTLIGIYLRVRPYRLSGRQDRWFVTIPFSVYLGWICVATIANISIALYSINWSGWGISPVTWTVIMLFIGTFLAGYMALGKGELPFTLVFVWAFTGIYAAQRDVELVPQVALALAVLLFIAVLVSRAVGAPRAKEQHL
jgi:translocator protein